MLAFEKYVDLAVVKKLSKKFRENLSSSLERNGQKYFTTSYLSNKSKIAVVRRFGITTNHLMKEFRITESEVTDLIKSGFVEKYSNLKLNAVFKDMIENIQSTFKESKYLDFEISEVYFNATHNIYDVDFTILVSIRENDLKNQSAIVMRNLTKDIMTILNFVEREYLKVK